MELTPNPKKCIATTFTHQPYKLQWNKPWIYINKTQIPSDTSPWYLGVLVDQHLNWRPHVKWILDKLEDRVRKIRALSSITHGIKTKQLIIFYNAYARPLLTYASPVWLQQAITRSATKELIERIEARAPRSILGAIQSTPRASLYAEAGIRPIEIEADFQSAKMAIRIQLSATPLWEQLSKDCTITSPLNQILMIGVALGCIDNKAFPVTGNRNSPTISRANYFSHWVIAKQRTNDLWQQKWNEADSCHEHRRVLPSSG